MLYATSHGDTRDRLVESSAELFRKQGYNATGVKQIVTAAQAPFASLYHFFPGGKEELGAEAIRLSGALYELLIPAVFDPAPDLAHRRAQLLRGRRGASRRDRLRGRLPDRDDRARDVEHQRAAPSGVRGRVRTVDRRRGGATRGWRLYARASA